MLLSYDTYFPWKERKYQKICTEIFFTNPYTKGLINKFWHIITDFHSISFIRAKLIAMSFLKLNNLACLFVGIHIPAISAHDSITKWETVNTHHIFPDCIIKYLFCIVSIAVSFHYSSSRQKAWKYWHIFPCHLPSQTTSNLLPCQRLKSSRLQGIIKPKNTVAYSIRA